MTLTAKQLSKWHISNDLEGLLELYAEYKSEYNEIAEILPVIPVDPCITCEYAAICAAKMTDCKAFRTYAATGKFKSTDIARLLKEIK